MLIHAVVSGAMRAGHKYVSRNPDGKGGYDYKYAEDAEGAKNWPPELQRAVAREKQQHAEGQDSGMFDKLVQRLHGHMNQRQVEHAQRQMHDEIDRAVVADRNGNTRKKVQHLQNAEDHLKHAGELSQKHSDLKVVDDDEHGSLAHRLNAGLKAKGSKHLGIARADMPQLSSANGVSAAFLESLRQRGVRVTADVVPVGSLKATQSEVSGPKILGMAKRVQEDDLFAAKVKAPIIVSRDGYILDGHHRWATLVSLDPDTQIHVHRVDLPIRSLLRAAGAFDGVEKKEIHEKSLFAALADPLWKAERPHTYLSRKPDGHGGWIYKYHQDVAQQNAPGADKQVDMFAGTHEGAEPVQRTLDKASPEALTKDLKHSGFAEGDVTVPRSGFHLYTHGESGLWLKVAYADYSHKYKDAGVDKEEFEHQQLEQIKKVLRAKGYIFNESYFGRHANVVLAAHWRKDEAPPKAPESKKPKQTDMFKHLFAVRQAWAAYSAAQRQA